ncbi:MAG: hypothetical protein ACYS1A_20185 [Planctomycetota bacterium]
MLNFNIKKMFERDGIYYYLFPTFAQGRKILWDGIDRDGMPFLNHFPPELIISRNNSEMKITLETKTGHSIFQIIGTDNYNSIMGTNPVGCTFSEYSLQNPLVWDFIRPILTENGGWALFNYTPRGKNHGWDLYEMARDNPKWFCQLLTVNHTKRPDGLPVISEEAIQDERDAGMDEDMIQQEYYCSFDAANQGAYYSNQFKKIDEEGRIRIVPYQPALPVETFWDLGVGDSNPIWFVQRNADKFGVIDFYENNNVGLDHYIPFVLSLPYNYSSHWAPHDIKVREYDSAMSRIESAKNMMARLRESNPDKTINGVKYKNIEANGIRFQVVPNISINDGIDAARRVLNKCYFDNRKHPIKPNEGLRGVGYGLNALRSYHKDLDEKNSTGIHKKYKDTPVHDWSSHASDAFRYFAVATKPKMDIIEALKQSQGKNNNYDS